MQAAAFARVNEASQADLLARMDWLERHHRELFDRWLQRWWHKHQAATRYAEATHALQAAVQGFDGMTTGHGEDG